MRSLWLFLLLNSLMSSASASLMEIEKSCHSIYRQSLAQKKMKDVCQCITSNIEARFTPEQRQELVQIYSHRRGRHEASKNERLKALLEFDSLVHQSCLQNPLWKHPKEDLGRPDTPAD